ncbi:hypothetical protein [Streptomyces soliscabiei]|uniref:hypothetical protein n=1 Tax=Streptomyces soliscabiei TaxID=588897 RepID=UPI0029A95220|nr:hypothetical protein [Streptomyces sp. NY05-11A]MDX2679377.1 hypothetical protein [Streptomyces sp. NY05-11A]
MRRVIKVLMMTLLALGIGVTPALAQNEHFVGEPTCTKSLSGNQATITCTGKVAGLGRGPASVFLSADSVRARYVCVNRGGNTAPGHPAFFGPLEGTSQTITPRAGQITFRATLQSPPNPPSSQVCPNGNWRVVLASATFVNVVLHVQQPVGTDVLTWNFGDIDPS